jgi:hypothetical protein
MVNPGREPLVSEPRRRRRAPAWAGPVLGVVTLALATGLATQVYDRWRTSDARSLSDAQLDHIVSFQDLESGAELELLAFPATERFAEVPRFRAKLNEWRVRERSFTASPAPGVRRVLAVGESSTFGTGLEAGERFTDLLGTELEARHPGCCEVLNAGRMGMTTPTAVQFVKDEVAAWGPTVLIYDSMANDMVDEHQPGAISLSSKSVTTYEAHLRDLARFCDEEGIDIVFWANTIAVPGDSLAGFRGAMERVAGDTGAGYVDLGQLYRDSPATDAEVQEFLGEPNWTQWFDVVHPPEVPLERVALHNDWVHPNRFGSRRLAAGLRPLVEQALALESP